MSATKTVLHVGDVSRLARSAPAIVMSSRFSFETRMIRLHVNQFAAVPLCRLCQVPVLRATHLASLRLRVEAQMQMIHPTSPRQTSLASASLHHSHGPRLFLKPQYRPQRIKLSRSSSRSMSCTHATMALHPDFSSNSLACSKRSKAKVDWLCGGLFVQLRTLASPVTSAVEFLVAKHCSAMDWRCLRSESHWRTLIPPLMITP